MGKQAAVGIIGDTFENPFDKGRFVHFAKNLLNKIDEIKAFPIIQGHYIPESFRDCVKTYERIGTYTDPANVNNKIDILIVHLQKEGSLERARTAQRNFVARYLKDRGEKEAGLIAFVSPDEEDWRFSLVKMEYKLAETPTGKVKVKEEFTPARRWSFLVGKNESSHTAQSQLVDILADDKNNPTLSTLENAFNIEVATREFFKRYRELFYNVKEELDNLVATDSIIGQEFDNRLIDTVSFAKKLLGQIVFLYFLQKKGWLGVLQNRNWGDGDKKFLRNLVEKCKQEKRNFFNDYLEYLFYDALNKQDRGGVDPSYYQRFDCRIPFLNGGLFDSDYEWVKTDIVIPNDIFSNRKDAGDEGSGILDVFDLYNFTVKEDEPLEKEVAVDPEMLGKVFENLLEVKDRKSKGTYYTPREIVHYMCQESLINYLDTAINTGDVPLIQTAPPQGKLFGQPDPQQATLKTSGYGTIIPREEIEELVRKGELVIENEATALQKLSDVEQGRIKSSNYKLMLKPSIRENAGLIDDKLNTIRVCDPAVGSGAFLVGMMTEVIRARNVLTDHVEDKERRTNYKFKRDAIQNCLYGVDIDPGAVEIAKLRLWLSLVVDEEDITQIKPLPNLDYKIVCGTSLLGFPFKSQRLTAIEQLKQQFFDETDHEKKAKLKSQVDQQLREAFAASKRSLGYEVNFDFEVYFSEVFREKGGFDVVIANPPYIGEKGHKEVFREIKPAPLGKFYQGKMDIFYFFFHLALNIGTSDGQIAFITTNYYPTAAGGRKLREDFRERTTIRRLINFNELRIFEAAQGQHNMLTILSKGHGNNTNTETCITTRTGITTPRTLQTILDWQDVATNYYQVSQNDLYDGKECYIRLTGSSGQSEGLLYIVFTKLQEQGKLLKPDFCDINNGIHTEADYLSQRKFGQRNDKNAKVGDGIYVLDRENENDSYWINQIEKSPKERKHLKPFYKNSDVGRYWTNTNAQKRVIYINKREDDIDELPHIKKHLSRFRTIIDASSDNSPYLHRPKNKLIFVQPKILAPHRSKTNTFGYNEVPWYASADVYFITQKNAQLKLKYVLALLNSRLYYLWLYFKGKRKGEALELYQVPLSEIPIKKISHDEQKPFITLVDKILAITKDEDYLTNAAKQTRVNELERQIDQMVYELYGLTSEEIGVVEGSFPQKR